MTSLRNLVKESLVNEDKLLSSQTKQVNDLVQSQLIVLPDAHTLILFIASVSLLQNPEYREFINMYISFFL